MELLVTSGHSTIAERSGKAVGYAITDVLGDTGFVVRVAVHPNAQGQGIGSGLLADALNHCRAAGARVVRLNTQESNTAAHRLYQRFDFRRAGRRVPVLLRGL
jgi:ribosomal-protein-alanine N-acetyltransferase